MQTQQALHLISHPAISNAFPTHWADFGAGSGLFTHALASLLAPGSKIIAIDKNVTVFEKNITENDVRIETLQADFTSATLYINDLDGILMANSFHFVRDKFDFIKKISSFFKDQECFLIVEYDTDQANPWVPFPVSFRSLKELFQKLGYNFIGKIHELPSRYNRANIYSALATR